MRAIAISNGYMSGKVYIVWEIPHDKITGFEVKRNDAVIASSSTEDKNIFVSPTMFDHDHQTNLFKKDSHFKLMYVDENVHRYQEYKYSVVAKRLDSENNLIEEVISNPIFITVQ